MIYQSEVTFILIGGMMFLAGFMLWRSSAMRKRLAQQDPLRDMHRELEQREQAPEGVIHDMESRLFDYGREVEGRIETTLSVLDRLIVDADQEIGRLEELLKEAKETRGDSSQNRSQRTLSLQKVDSENSSEFNAKQFARVRNFIAAGLSDEEIAKCLDCTTQLVKKYRTQFNDDQQTDAA